MPTALARRPGPPPVPAVDGLEAARRRISPRHSPPPGSSWPALLIHGGLTVLWLALLARAFLPDGLWSWAAGLLYIAYDTALLLFVFWKTLPLVGGAAGAAQGRNRPATPLARRPSLAVVVAAHDEDVVLALLWRFAERDRAFADSTPGCVGGEGSRWTWMRTGVSTWIAGWSHF